MVPRASKMDQSGAQDSQNEPQRSNKSPQSAAYKVFSSLEVVSDLSLELSRKLVVTLGEEWSCRISLSPHWLGDLSAVLPLVKQHTSMCCFKTILGGWTTSARMHEPVKLQCIFGCRDELDCMNHYLLCAPLWHICSEVINLEAPLIVGERIGIVNPSVDKLRLLALVFQVYHYTKSRAKELGGVPCMTSNAVQRIAFEAAHTFKTHI